MQTKFIITLIISFGFLLLYGLIKKRAKAFTQAPIIQGEVVDAFILDPQESKFDFSIDRGESLGNFITVKYTLNGIEKTYESSHIKNHYQIGQTVSLQYLDDERILLADEGGDDKKMSASFLICFAVLFLAAMAGIIMDLRSSF